MPDAAAACLSGLIIAYLPRKPWWMIVALATPVSRWIAVVAACLAQQLACYGLLLITAVKDA